MLGAAPAARATRACGVARASGGGAARALRKCSVLGAQRSVLSARCSVLSARCEVLDVKCSVPGARCPVLNSGAKVPRAWGRAGGRFTLRTVFVILDVPARDVPGCGSGGTGRRASLRSLWGQPRGGSNPPFRTNLRSRELTQRELRLASQWISLAQRDRLSIGEPREGCPPKLQRRWTPTTDRDRGDKQNGRL